MSVSKTFIFLMSCAPSELVPRSFQNAFRKLLTLNLDKERGSHPAFSPTSLITINIFSILCMLERPSQQLSHLTAMSLYVGHCIGQGHYDGRKCGCTLHGKNINICIAVDLKFLCQPHIKIRNPHSILKRINFIA